MDKQAVEQQLCQVRPLRFGQAQQRLFYGGGGHSVILALNHTATFTLARS